MSATRVLAGVTLRRLVRGRALWVGGGVAVFPAVFAAVLSQRPQSVVSTFRDVRAFELLVLAVLPALFVGASIGEDIEDRTTTYLWSRPIPRWAILVGKLLALVPVVAAMSAASWAIALYAGTSEVASLSSLAAFAAGAAALSCMAAAFATLVPKHAMALSICYMLLVDLPVGALPASLRELSVTHQVRVIADQLYPNDESGMLAALGMGIIAAVFLVIGLLRVRRLEA